MVNGQSERLQVALTQRHAAREFRVGCGLAAENRSRVADVGNVKREAPEKGAQHRRAICTRTREKVGSARCEQAAAERARVAVRSNNASRTAPLVGPCHPQEITVDRAEG